MVTGEAYATVVAENAALQADLAAALQQIAVLEAQKRPPPAFVKANAPARPRSASSGHPNTTARGAWSRPRASWRIGSSGVRSAGGT